MKQPFRSSQFEANKSLSQLSTFGIGGPAQFFTEVQKTEDLQALLQYCHGQKLPFLILGKGSNCLFDDRGFDGLVILNKIDFVERPSDGVYYVGAGYSFSLLGVQTARQGWTGLEFASGIPGSVGGAVYMNAGAGGSDISQVVTRVDCLTEEGEQVSFARDALAFSYRT